MKQIERKNAQIAKLRRQLEETGGVDEEKLREEVEAEMMQVAVGTSKLLAEELTEVRGQLVHAENVADLTFSLARRAIWSIEGQVNPERLTQKEKIVFRNIIDAGDLPADRLAEGLGVSVEDLVGFMNNIFQKNVDFSRKK